MKKAMVLIFAVILLASVFFGAKIAFIGPISGPNSIHGVSGRDAFLLAVEQAVAKGLPFELQYEVFDDNSNTDTAVAIAKKIGEDPEFITVIAHWNSGLALATKPVFHSFGVPVLVWGAVHPDITMKDDFPEINRLPSMSTFQNFICAQFLSQNGYSKVGVLYENTDYGKAHKDAFVDSLAQLGLDLTLQKFIITNKTSYASDINVILRGNPQVLYYGGYTKEAVVLVKNLNESGKDLLFVGTTGISDDIFPVDGGEGAEGSISMRITPIEEMPGGSAFLKIFTEKYNETAISPYVVHAYDSTNIVIEALIKAGSNLTRENVVKTLRDTRDFQGVMGSISFDSNGQSNLKDISVFVAQDSKWVVWEKSDYFSGIRSLKGK